MSEVKPVLGSDRKRSLAIARKMVRQASTARQTHWSSRVVAYYLNRASECRRRAMTEN